MKQPNSRHCFVCGIENPYGLQLKFYVNAGGHVVAEYVVPDRFQGYPGVVHGGIVAAMLDEVCGRVHMQGPPGQTRFMVTARLSVRFRKNVPVGQRLRLVGQAGTDKRRAATSTAAIYGPGDELLAEADAILFPVPEGAFAGMDWDALGWKVYEDLDT